MTSLLPSLITASYQKYDSLSTCRIILPNFTPIACEMTEPRGFFKEVAPSKKKKNNNNKMSSDIRTVPDLKK